MENRAETLLAELEPTEDADNLWKLVNATTIDFNQLMAYANRAIATGKSRRPLYVETALEYLTKIEDAIKRYREGRPQAYEGLDK